MVEDGLVQVGLQLRHGSAELELLHFCQVTGAHAVRGLARELGHSAPGPLQISVPQDMWKHFPSSRKLN